VFFEIELMLSWEKSGKKYKKENVKGDDKGPKRLKIN